ncbi:FecR family protein [Dyadobacter aurulentus]|uniref:FecR family protein n=1 Tax=Dyadobacter sp. UC 10 TaxID=2605428 RepID=UPI0011F3AA43|nr:FecR family protein [Dyadobacter sp. UC 10]KAA0992201.1 FecR family protein [Dyadobacter sp. UC 10]
MSEYLEYEPEDFASDDFFIHWVKSTDIAAETFWQNWLETYPFKRQDVEAARQLVLLTQNLPQPQVSESELSHLKASIFNKIDAAEPKPARLWVHIPAWVAAASITGLLLLAGWLLINRNHISDERYPSLVAKAAEKYDLIEVKNLTRAVRLINLPDGSSVILKKGSMLSYPQEFEKNSREVYLTGEGFFEITRNPEKPFYVHANQITTKVLGTSFNVRAYPDQQQVLVSVTTGRVSVYKAGSEESRTVKATRSLKGLVLSANQKALYAGNRIVLMSGQPELAQIPPGEEMSFEYEEKPAGEIFADLEKTYGITIVYDPTVIGNCPVTASLTGEPLNEKLKLLCKAIHAGYEYVNGEIVVSGKGCE